MHVTELWRFPVKSLGGERVDEVRVRALGLDGDRRFGIVDDESGLMLTARRVGELLYASAAIDRAGVAITLPDGTSHHSSDRAATDAALSAWLDRPVHLLEAERGVTAEMENPLDFELETDWMRWTSPDGAFHDSGRTRVSLVSTRTLGAWDARRFRTNIVVEGPLVIDDGDGATLDRWEDDLVDERIGLGPDAVLHVRKRIDRCVMVTRPQPGGPDGHAIERDLDVLRTIHRERESCLGIGCLVRAEGVVRVGDEVLARL